jgi:hypothetical protein
VGLELKMDDLCHGLLRAPHEGLERRNGDAKQFADATKSGLSTRFFDIVDV